MRHALQQAQPQRGRAGMSPAIGRTVPLNPGLTAVRTAARPLYGGRSTGAVAWRRRELVFERTPLNEVAAEFNRYNRQQLRVSGGALSRKEISGIFSADYPQSLILFLRKDSNLEVEETGGAWVVRER